MRIIKTLSLSRQPLGASTSSRPHRRRIVDGFTLSLVCVRVFPPSEISSARMHYASTSRPSSNILSRQWCASAERERERNYNTLPSRRGSRHFDPVFEDARSLEFVCTEGRGRNIPRELPSPIIDYGVVARLSVCARVAI